MSESQINKQVDERVKEIIEHAKQEADRRYPAELIDSTRTMECPLLVMGDSYKAGHFKMYQKAKTMIAYGEFREGMEKKGINDPRIVVYGMRHIINQLVSRIITQKDLEWARSFYSTHGVGNKEYEFPQEMFQEIVKLGHFPVKIEALPDGSVVLPHTPVFFITAEDKYSRFCTFLETVLTMIWYPSTVATLSKHTKCLIEDAFEKTVDGGKGHLLLNSRLHDFGFRGCTCVEQSVIGGSAHLLNFDGSDTMSACFHVQYHLNGGNPVGTSIPATEHSVMTSFENEKDAILNLIKKYPGQIVACVMDSYNYDYALDTYLPVVRKAIGEGTFVIRPDSGDPVVQVLKALRAAVKAGFDCRENTQGYKVLKNVAVIQGDGINYQIVREILEAVDAAGFSAENVAFGMGGGLLQKVDRDTLSFATKLCYVRFENGVEMKVIKAPFRVPGKRSLPGKMRVMKAPATEASNVRHHTVFPADMADEMMRMGYRDSMITVYDEGDVDQTFLKEPFQNVRERLAREWYECEECFKIGGNWASPLDTTMIAVQEAEAEKAEKKAVGPKPGEAYVSPIDLYNDAQFEEVNAAIDRRMRAIAAEKEMKAANPTQSLVDDALEHLRRARETAELAKEGIRDSKKLVDDLEKALARRELEKGT